MATRIVTAIGNMRFIGRLGQAIGDLEGRLSLPNESCRPTENAQNLDASAITEAESWQSSRNLRMEIVGFIVGIKVGVGQTYVHL